MHYSYCKQNIQKIGFRHFVFAYRQRPTFEQQVIDVLKMQKERGVNATGECERNLEVSAAEDEHEPTPMRMDTLPDVAVVQIIRQ